ncbi:hypothetical protein KSF73_09945 [Burkholderiaceae bacterium DAT-1]|nr:hypothetical protein [Burkholderiaceae bacterium DAT-1]
MLAVCCCIAHADEPDLDALALADKAPEQTIAARDWRLFTELATGQSMDRAWQRHSANRRISLDMQFDHSPASDWRLYAADRLDVMTPAEGDHAINTLKEAWLGWKVSPAWMLDAGRINLHQGVATGFNPNDFFRAHAVRAPVSIDPASLRENRLGSVMLRSQYLWEGGSLTGVYSPKLANHADTGGWQADWGASNGSDRWLLTASQQWSPGLAPQWLIYHEAGQPVQFGANLSGLLNDATVLFVEWTGGRSHNWLAQATGQAGDTPERWHNQVSAGATWTSASKLSLTLEYHASSAALDTVGWGQLQRGPLPAYLQYRHWLADQQLSPTSRSVFVRANWQDALINHLDLTAMLDRDCVDASKRTWLEARYHAGSSEWAWQWQHHGGAPLSTWGAMPISTGWQLIWRRYM